MPRPIMRYILLFVAFSSFHFAYFTFLNTTIMRCYPDIHSFGDIDSKSLALAKVKQEPAIVPKSIMKTKEPMFVLVLANAGRSGSSLLAELLATEKNTVLFFEPLFVMNGSPILENGTVVSQFLEDIFKCTYTHKFGEWFRYYTLFRDFYHPTVRDCKKDANLTECIKNIDFRGLCQKATVRIVKVIRAPITSMENLIRNPTLNLKLIHLQRDPRATLSSTFTMGWQAIPTDLCPRMLSNTLSYEALVQKYPTRIYQVRFEELCQYPKRTLGKLYAFLEDNATLPEPILQYVKTHMTPEISENDSMSTAKNSLNETQAWRWEINATLFQSTEKESSCRITIERYGHRVFGSLEKLRDPNIPLTLQ